jgi:hypothetical protein
VDAATKLNRADCRAAVDGYFSAGRMAEDHVALYERVIEQFKRKGVPGGAYVKENQRQVL